MGPAVRIDGGESPEAALGQVGQLGFGEHAHASPPGVVRSLALVPCRYSRAPSGARSTRSATSGFRRDDGGQVEGKLLRSSDRPTAVG